MNKERMLALADLIENLPKKKFHMNYWSALRYLAIDYKGDKYLSDNIQSNENLNPNECGTVCCIAGWATAMKTDFKPLEIPEESHINFMVPAIAKEYLELTQREANNLFYIGPDTVWMYISDKFDLQYCYCDEEWKNITNKAAAFAIRGIANNEIDISDIIDYDWALDFIEENCETCESEC